MMIGAQEPVKEITNIRLTTHVTKTVLRAWEDRMNNVHANETLQDQK